MKGRCRHRSEATLPVVCDLDNCNHQSFESRRLAETSYWEILVSAGSFQYQYDWMLFEDREGQEFVLDHKSGYIQYYDPFIIRIFDRHLSI